MCEYVCKSEQNTEAASKTLVVYCAPARQTYTQVSRGEQCRMKGMC